MLRDLDQAARTPCFTRGLVVSRASQRLTSGPASVALHARALEISAHKAMTQGPNEAREDLTSLMGVAVRLILAARRTAAV